MGVVRSGFRGDQDLDEQFLRVAEVQSVSILVKQRIVDADLVEVLADEESLRKLVECVEAPGSMTTRSSPRIRLSPFRSTM